MMTIAPELPGALDLIQSLEAQGTIASLGHTNATYEQTLEGFLAGIHHVTHLFNAMRSLHHRDPGPLAAILNHHSVTAQIIPDGVHVEPPILQLAMSQLASTGRQPFQQGRMTLVDIKNTSQLRSAKIAVNQ